MLTADQTAVLVSFAKRLDPALTNQQNLGRTFDPSEVIEVSWRPKHGYFLRVLDFRPESSSLYDEHTPDLFWGTGQTIGEAYEAACINARYEVDMLDDELTSEGEEFMSDSFGDVDVRPVVTEAQRHYVFDEPRCFGEVSKRRWKRSHNRETRRNVRNQLRTL